MLSFNTTFSTKLELQRKINMPGSWNRIAADIETNEAFPDRETNPTDFDNLEGYNPNRPRICSPKQPGQINARPGKRGLGTVQKKIHPGIPEVTFLGTDTSFAQSHPTLLKKYLIEGNCSS